MKLFITLLATLALSVSATPSTAATCPTNRQTLVLQALARLHYAGVIGYYPATRLVLAAETRLTLQELRRPIRRLRNHGSIRLELSPTREYGFVLTDRGRAALCGYAPPSVFP